MSDEWLEKHLIKRYDNLINGLNYAEIPKDCPMAKLMRDAVVCLLEGSKFQVQSKKESAWNWSKSFTTISVCLAICGTMLKIWGT